MIFPASTETRMEHKNGRNTSEINGLLFVYLVLTEQLDYELALFSVLAKETIPWDHPPTSQRLGHEP